MKFKELVQEALETKHVIKYSDRHGNAVYKSFPTETAANDWRKGKGRQFSPGRPKEMTAGQLKTLKKQAKDNSRTLPGMSRP